MEADVFQKGNSNLSGMSEKSKPEIIKDRTISVEIVVIELDISERQ